MGITLENVANVEMLPMPMLPVPIGSVGSDPKGMWGQALGERRQDYRISRIDRIGGLQSSILNSLEQQHCPLAVAEELHNARAREEVGGV